MPWVINPRQGWLLLTGGATPAPEAPRLPLTGRAAAAALPLVQNSL